MRLLADWIDTRGRTDNDRFSSPEGESLEAANNDDSPPGTPVEEHRGSADSSRGAIRFLPTDRGLNAADRETAGAQPSVPASFDVEGNSPAAGAGDCSTSWD